MTSHYSAPSKLSHLQSVMCCSSERKIYEMEMKLTKPNAKVIVRIITFKIAKKKKNTRNLLNIPCSFKPYLYTAQKRGLKNRVLRNSTCDWSPNDIILYWFYIIFYDGFFFVFEHFF